MSIETEFESTITNVKNAYQGLDNLGATIPQNKTIENIKSCLDEIYNKFPKTEYQEGTEITLSNTLKGKLDFEKIYQEVEYIEDSGSSYIDTGMKLLENNIEVKTKVYTANMPSNQLNIISNYSSSSAGFTLGLYTQKVFLYNNGNINVTSAQLSGEQTLEINAILDYTNNIKKMSINNSEYIEQTYNRPIQNENNNIHIFAGANHSFAFVGRLYYLKLYVEGDLKLDLIPCYRKLDNVIGLYDKVSGKFYTNAGTGTFTKGEDVGSGFGDIVGYGQTSQKSYEGYNLLNSAGGSVAYKPEGTIIIDSKGVINASIDMGYASINIPSITLKAGKTYTFKRNFTGSRNSWFVDTNNNNVLGIGYNQTSATLTPESDIIINKLNGALSSGDNYFWLYEGTTTKDFEPYVGGQASPNPSYPQDIEVVRGKNRFNPSVSGLYANGCTVSLNGDEISISATQNGDIYVGNVKASGGSYEANRGVKIPVAPLTSYILSLTNSNVNKLFITEYDSNNISLGFVQSNTITTQANTSYITIRYGLENAISGTTYKTNIQLEKGSQATSYLPYNTLEIEESGKNLLKLENVNEVRSGVSIKVDSTNIKLNGTATGSITVNQYPTDYYLEAGTYTMKSHFTGSNDKKQNFALYNSTTLIAYVVYNGNSSEIVTTFTLSEKTQITRIALWITNGAVCTDFSMNLQIEEGSTATTYEPYQEPKTYQLSLGEYEFAKIGNYVDTIEYDVENDKVYKNKAIEKIANKTNWTVGSIASNNRAIIGLRTNGYQNAVNSFSTANGLSNSFIGVSQSAIASTTQTNVIAINGDNIYIKFPDEINTKELAKAQLDSMTNLDFYYPLATALKEEITGTLKDQIKEWYNSQSFTGTTIITSNGELPLVLKVRALKGE